MALALALASRSAPTIAMVAIAVSESTTSISVAPAAAAVPPAPGAIAVAMTISPLHCIGGFSKLLEVEAIALVDIMNLQESNTLLRIAFGDALQEVVHLALVDFAIVVGVHFGKQRQGLCLIDGLGCLGVVDLQQPMVVEGIVVVAVLAMSPPGGGVQSMLEFLQVQALALIIVKQGDELSSSVFHGTGDFGLVQECLHLLTLHFSIAVGVGQGDQRRCLLVVSLIGDGRLGSTELHEPS
mmetsp:Transcript_7580/g.10935  ORF Transcript_7580/g.10935 Transcript_7580/m.10935 type:complete len:240 (-) Transcript_7580:850-1569(-)